MIYHPIKPLFYPFYIAHIFYFLKKNKMQNGKNIKRQLF